MPDVPTHLPAAPRAIFVSYSHDDAAAARRIAENLRAHGIEVWFDENELRSGDTWDAKIKQQIRDCALFLPVISQNTQRRREGYFRLEWHLAEERSRLIARGTPFLVPVVIDDTGERAALVPEVFLSVQWTRLREGEATAAFAERVKALLGDDVGPVADRAPAQRAGLEPKVGRRVPATAWIGFAAAMAIAVASFIALRPSPNAGAGTRPPTAEKPVTAAASPLAPAGPRLGPKSIAVLPFDNLSEDKDANAFFAVGMHEDVISSLYLIRELRPIPRATVMTYLGTKKTPREIADELGVAFLLNGTVRRAGETVRMTATLFNPRTEETLWNKPYNRDVKAIFAIQAELAQAIASELKAVLSPEERQLVGRKLTENLVAYDYYLKAREGWENQTSDLDEMEAFLNKAVDLDPRFAAAWGALASIHSNAYFFSRDTTPARLQKADIAIATATRLAPETPEVLLSQGDYFYRAIRDYERALSHYNRVLLLRPNDPEVYNAIASVQRRQGKWVEAVATGRRSVALDPNQSRATFDLGWLLISGRRYDEGIDELRRLTPKPNIGLNAAYWVAESVWFASGSNDKMDKLFAAEGRDETIRRQLNERRAIWAVRTGDLATAVELIDFLKPPTGGSWWPADKVGRALVAKVAGRDQDAKETLEPIKQALLLQRKTEPKNPRVWCTLGLIEVLTGDKQEAIRCALRATQLQPESSDAYRGPAFSVCLALVYTWADEKEKAINEFARLLGTPIEQPLNVHEMRQSLWFRPLQGDPRFEALLNDPKNNAPLF